MRRSCGSCRAVGRHGAPPDIGTDDGRRRPWRQSLGLAGASGAQRSLGAVRVWSAVSDGRQHAGHERARAATSQAPAQGRQGLPVGGPRQRDRDGDARGGAGGDGRAAARPRLDGAGAERDPDPAAAPADAARRRASRSGSRCRRGSRPASGSTSGRRSSWWGRRSSRRGRSGRPTSWRWGSTTCGGGCARCRPRDLHRDTFDGIPVRILQSGVGCASALVLVPDELRADLRRRSASA